MGKPYLNFHAKHLIYYFSRMYVVAFAVILLDYASQAAINPCESLMADMLQSMHSQSETGFMIYSAMLSMGSCIGYLLSAVDWQTLSQNQSHGQHFCSSEQTAILIVLVLFSITLLVTMIAAKERPMIIQSFQVSNNGKVPLEEMLLPHSSLTRPSLWTLQTIRKSFRLTFILALLIKVVNTCLIAILRPLKTVYEAPMVLKRLFWADLLCWMAIMAHSMFCTDYVATVVYGGNAYAERGSIDDLRFDEGVRMGSLGLLLHSITACLFSSFVQDSIANLIGLKNTYIFGLAIFGLSMGLTVVFPSVIVLNICAAFSGLGFAVATTIPCTLITRYHEQPEVFFRDTRIGNFISLFDVVFI